MSPTVTTPADSPFIPGTTLQYAWDSVSLTAAMACWRRYYYQIILGLQPRGPARAIALDFGIAFHKGLELYHTYRAAGDDHTTATHHTIFTLPQLCPEYSKLPTDDEHSADIADLPDDDDGIHARNQRIRTRYHLIRAIVWYLDHYAEDAATTLTLPSGAAAVELSFRIPLPIHVGDRDMLLSGHIDRAVEINTHYYIVDYKTTKSLSRQFFSDFELSHQISGYTLAGKVILDRPIAGAMIDGIALQVGGVQFARHLTTRTPGQLDEYLETLQDTMLEAQRHTESGLYPMNTSACYFCQYKNACNKPPEYREGYLTTLFEAHKPWNPLENR